MAAPGGRDSRPLFLLPLACSLLPAAAVIAAWWLSVRAGYVPDCIPHLEGCTSISRAARHGAANVVFKLVMIPCALLQALMWIEARRWIGVRHPDARAGRSLYPLGIAAGIALAVYAAFLGTDGAIYQWLRRFGIVAYFGATVVAIFVFTHRLLQLGIEKAVAYTMLALCGLLLAFGLAGAATRAIGDDPDLKDRLEDVLEWNLGTVLVLWPLALAALWKRTAE